MKKQMIMSLKNGNTYEWVAHVDYLFVCSNGRMKTEKKRKI